ncbi:putative E3 ubiquitin-protein ligase SH3RF2 isoform X5 [Octodon degus]|uniref:E3 ubiquitin-protein ligase SH3RF2 n=1 Tax=Octodon degus TaxID=10160 RepID=A0A6P6EFP0_OCTDE|nr:putative E3 ubiquitin-protein ligase SH3RF2 isoform X5 [Octodon degus]
MDDLTLLDLLECPVCFEKLDVTAKVLPCQHTFCKPCLQRIFKAHKELRCPECRTLVFCSIEALPANLLLVRLLDGVRSGQNSGRGGSFRRPGVLTSQDSRKSRTSPRSLQASSFRLVPNIRIHMDGVPRAKALCNYRGQNPGDLRFNKGDVILLRRQLDENWYQGEINGDCGIFPASSVEVIKQLPQPPPLCRALYNFDLRDKDKSDNKDCLTFLKDDIITVISRVDENWAEGKLGDKVGIFPILFVEVSTYHPAPASPGHSVAVVGLPSSQKHLSANMFVALHSYSAHGPNELDLQKGEGVRVLGKYQDGWLRGVSLVTGRVGIFPNNYVIPIFRKASSFPDSQSPGLYTTWTLSTSSVSSQGSVSEGVPRQSQTFKSVFVPTAIVNPVKNTAGSGALAQGSFRKGRNSMRKSKWWQRDGSLQRPAQSGIPTLMMGSLRRSPTMIAGPQHFQFYAAQGVPSSLSLEMGPKPASTGEPVLTCIGRGSESRIHSAASSLIMEGKEVPTKSEPPPKPPASAPPSILVKPENSRNGIEKQVKTVRFQNYSPPPTKHYASHPTSGKPEQPATLKGPQPEPVGPEMTILFAHRSGSHSGQPTDRRKSVFGKATTPVPSASATQTTFPSK